MKRLVLVCLMVACHCQTGWSQESSSDDANANAIRERLLSYIATFNAGDAKAVAAYWTQDAVSCDGETGERTVGREALQQGFVEFFEANAGARLAGSVDNLRMIRPDVAEIEGEVTLIVPGQDPVPSAFTAILVKDGDQWLMSSSHEQELPTPPTAYDALKELEWMVGSWQDQTDGVQVHTTVRWTPSQSFLLRSFNAQFGDGEMVEGTQVFGWDPANKTIRTWTFNSDGSYGDGTVAKNGDEWNIKMAHMLSDGRLATATQVVKRIDDDTIEVEKIGETIDGEPVPASEPITVVRTADADAVSATEAPATEGEGQ